MQCRRSWRLQKRIANNTVVDLLFGKGTFALSTNGNQRALNAARLAFIESLSSDFYCGGVRSETWVTERSGDMGYTFRPEGGGEEMPWKERSVMDERMRFVIRLKDGETMASLCREFGISRKTGYKIFERYEQCGLEGLSE
jgi:Homeodomain-like domain-containing protein